MRTAASVPIWVIAVKAAGCSVWKVLRPTMLLGGALSAGLMLISGELIPRANHAFREAIFRDAEESYRCRSKDHRIAAKVLELHLHPFWLEHCLNDVPLPRATFHEVYAAAFPGAAFSDLHRVVTAMHWEAPAG